MSESENSNPDNTLSEVQLGTKSDEVSSSVDTPPKKTMGQVGFEPNSQKSPQPTENKELNDIACHTPTHEGVHDPVHHSVFCSELQKIINHWDSLPEHIKTVIKILVQSHIQGDQK
ncbi:MAG: hypothetical protein ACYSU5_24095 [Planctomycetota bacterium]|jgi:hypothetical protein